MNIELYKKILKEKGMTYEDLAHETGLSLGCIKRIMAEIAKYPRIDTVQAIESALGLNEGARSPSPALSENEETLLRYFRALTPELQGVAIDTVRVLAGVPAGNCLQKKA